MEEKQRSRKHQVIWNSPGVWWNDVAVESIHTGPSGGFFGYARVGQVWFLVSHDPNLHLPVWHVVGWIRQN
jgi:hypothetical protein